MRIIRARLKPFGGSAEFISVKGRIKGLIEKNREDIFHFVIDEDGVKTVKEFGPDNINPELVNQSIIILDGPYYAKFNEDGTIDVVEEQNESIFSRKSEDDKIAIHFIDRLKKIKKSDKVCNIQRLDDDNKPEWFVAEEPRKYYIKQGYIIKFEDVDMVIVSYTFGIHDERVYFYLGNNISNMCEEVEAEESYLDKIFYLTLQISENKESKRRIGNLNPAAEPIEESLPRERSVKQLKKLRSMTKGIDIGDRISDLNKQGANIDYYRNPIDSGIESFEDFEKNNKKFIPSWNLKHLLSPFPKKKKSKDK